MSQTTPGSVVIALGQYASWINWQLRYYLWRFNSPITYFEGSKLDDLTLVGGDGKDTIFGDAGNDFILEVSAANGADEIWGGAGARDEVPQPLVHHPRKPRSPS